MNHKLIFFLIGFLLCGSLTANPGPLKREIRMLLTEIRQSLPTSQATDTNLIGVIDHLNQAMLLLEDTTDNSFDPSCIDFSYDKYYAIHNSSTAADKAQEACQIIKDLKVAKFLFDKYYINYNSSRSMDKAAAGSGFATIGKIDIIKFAYEKYYINHVSYFSADKALEGAATVTINTLGCLQSYYDKYYVNYSSSTAMDKSFAACH